MNTANITIIFLGSVSLLLTIVCWILFAAKHNSEQNSRILLGQLRDRLDGLMEIKGQYDAKVSEADNLREEKSRAEDDARRALKDLGDLSAKLATAEAEATAARDAMRVAIEQEQQRTADILKAKDDEIVTLKEFFEQAKQSLGTEFKALSADTLKEVASQFEAAAKRVVEQNSEKTVQDVKLHKQQIENLIQPMEKTLKDLDQQVKLTNEKRQEAETVLMTQIREFAGSNERLANALNKPVIRGSFAEVKLESLLEAAGLVRGENFELQVQVKDGEQLRIVDALVNMAQGKKLVIDSKNLLKPYVEYANAAEEDQGRLLAEFQKAFRTTLKSLALKDYSKHWQGIDAVIMFLPDEGMYMAAIEADRQLIATMYEHRVFVVSPVSLLPILKSVAYVLGLEKQNKDTQQIVDLGKALYESLGVILGKVHTLGDKLEKGMTAYNEVVKSFEGNVLPKTRKFRELGVQRGAAHPELGYAAVERRDFKDRVIRELCEHSVDGHIPGLED